MHLKHHKYIN